MLLEFLFPGAHLHGMNTILLGNLVKGFNATFALKSALKLCRFFSLIFGPCFLASYQLKLLSKNRGTFPRRQPKTP